MNNELVQITLPLTQEGLLGAALLLVLFGVVALALFGDGLKSNDEPMVRALKAFAWVYGIVWLFVFLGTLQTLWFVFTGTGPEGHGEDIRSLGMGALIAALLGAPFVIWGTVLRQKSNEIQARIADLQDSSLFNDKLANAMADLSARMDVTRSIIESDEEKILIEKQDDVLCRSAAIDRLEGLMLERPSEANRICGILALYVRELSRQNQPVAHDFSDLFMRVDFNIFDFKKWIDSQGHDDSDHEKIYVEPYCEWALGISPWRVDVEKAVQVLGRISESGMVERSIRHNLKGANLQGFDLSGLSFFNVDFSYAVADGVKFDNTSFSSCLFKGCILGAADFSLSSLKDCALIKCFLIKSRFELARLINVKINYATLAYCYSPRVTFSMCDLGYSNLNFSEFSFSSLTNNKFRRTELVRVNLTNVVLDESVFEFCDLTSSSFSGASMKNVLFFEGRADRNIIFDDADFTGAAFKNISLMMLDHILVDYSYVVDNAFGDESVNLPDTIERPKHWPAWDFDDSRFILEWKKWLKNRQDYKPPRS